MRLINADYLRSIYSITHAHFDSIESIRQWIDKTPTVDAEPVTHGKWEPYEFGDATWHKCSVCGTADKYINIVVRKGFADVRLVSKRNYCPICGAKMDLQ